MGYPFDAGSSFARYPSYYVHDAFGHVGADDVGKREPCFRKIPHSGLDVSPKERGDTKADILSPVFGQIVLQGFDKEAGNYQVVKHERFNEWWILGHHSKLLVKGGYVQRGTVIAKMGMTGGALGVHTHIAVATSLAGAIAYIGGWTQYRNGRSVGAWAKQAIRGRDQKLYGLLDPWPLIEREWADEEARLKAAAAEAAARAIREAAERAAAEKAAAEAARQEEDTDMIAIRNTNTGGVYYAAVRYLRHETYGPAGERIAALLTREGKIVDLDEAPFREVLNALGIPLSAEGATLGGKVWTPTTGVIDARSIKL